MLFLRVSSPAGTVVRYADSSRSEQLPQRRRADDRDPHAQRLHARVDGRLGGREERTHRLLQHLSGVIGPDGAARLKTPRVRSNPTVPSERERSEETDSVETEHESSSGQDGKPV